MQFPLPFAVILIKNIVFDPALVFRIALQVENMELVWHMEEEKQLEQLGGKSEYGPGSEVTDRKH